MTCTLYPTGETVWYFTCHTWVHLWWAIGYDGWTGASTSLALCRQRVNRLSGRGAELALEPCWQNRFHRQRRNVQRQNETEDGTVRTVLSWFTNDRCRLDAWRQRCVDDESALFSHWHRINIGLLLYRVLCYDVHRDPFVRVKLSEAPEGKVVQFDTITLFARVLKFWLGLVDRPPGIPKYIVGLLKFIEFNINQ